MATYTKLSYTAGNLNTQLAEFCSQLLENGVVDAIMSPMLQLKQGVMQTLITKKEHLSKIDPFAPVMPVNSAKLASQLTAEPSGKTIALIMRSCEIRALIELVKLNQATLDRTLLICIDCLGRYENTDFLRFQKAGRTTEDFLSAALEGKTAQEDYDVAGACRICEYPTLENVDLQLCLIGSGSGTLFVAAMSEKGEKALNESRCQLVDAPAGREEALSKVAAKRDEARTTQFTAFREETASFAALEEKLAACINCYNCRVACPVCYCKECVFVTDTFRHKGEQFITWASKDGQLKMPTDTLFYHLTRITHIAAFCVGCGQCTSACPNDIDLMPLFRTSAEKVQARFNYLAGRSVDEPQPLTVFESDELTEVTGQVK